MSVNDTKDCEALRCEALRCEALRCEVIHIVFNMKQKKLEKTGVHKKPEMTVVQKKSAKIASDTDGIDTFGANTCLLLSIWSVLDDKQRNLLTVGLHFLSHYRLSRDFDV
jgi:hypothetical protein